MVSRRAAAWLSSAVRIVSAVMALLFAWSVELQWNDPDPVQWMAIYGAAMVLAGWFVWKKQVPWIWPVLVAIVAAAWAGTLLPGVLREAEWGDLVKTMKHENHAEEARELGGLSIVAVWNGVLALVAWRRAPGRRWR